MSGLERKGSQTGPIDPTLGRTSEVVPHEGLLDTGKDLLALLSAYDEAQADMTPEEREAMNQRLAEGEEDFTVTNKEHARRRAAVEAARLQRTTIGEGLHTVRSLEEASEHIPGIKGVIRILAKERGPVDPGNEG